MTMLAVCAKASRFVEMFFDIPWWSGVIFSIEGQRRYREGPGSAVADTHRLVVIPTDGFSRSGGTCCPFAAEGSFLRAECRSFDCVRAQRALTSLRMTILKG